MVAPISDRTITRNVDALVSELRLSMRSLHRGAVAVLGVAGIGEIDPGVEELLVRETYSGVGSLAHLNVLPTDEIRSHFRRRAVEPSDLADAALAAELGRELEADYVVTGMVIASPRSIHLFERVIRTADGEVISAAQVMMPR